MQGQPERPRQTRQPSRLSVVSSALSSASEGEGAADETMDAEGSEDDLSEDQVEEEEDEEEEDEDYQKQSSGKRSRGGPSGPSRQQAAQQKPSKSIKITLRKSPQESTTSKAAGSKKSSKSSGTAAPKSAAVAAVRRGNQIVQSDDGDDDEDEDEDAVGEEDDDVEEEEEDELSDPNMSVPAAQGGESDEFSDDDDDEEGARQGSSSNMPKTARQLAREAGLSGTGGGEELMQLPMNDDSRKIKRTDAEIALKRSEMARRRRYQSDKKLEDEKTETINRLLKKQVGRKSTRELAKDRQSQQQRAGGGSGSRKKGGDEEDEEDDEEEGGGGAAAADGEEFDEEDGGRGAADVDDLRKSGTRGSRNLYAGMSRKEWKDRPLPFYRTIISRDATTVSVPIVPATTTTMTAATTTPQGSQGQDEGPYMAKWRDVFGGSKAAQPQTAEAEGTAKAQSEAPQSSSLAVAAS